MKNYAVSFGKCFLYLDIYGHKVDLFINARSQVRSKFGAFISILVFIACLLTFLNGFMDWLNERNLQTISSWKNYNVNELLKNNKSFTYDIDYKNFNIYFIIYYNNGHGTNILFRSLEKYFVQKLRYSDNKTISHDVELEACLRRNQNQFLLDNYNETDNSRSQMSLCIKSDANLSFDLVADNQNGRVITTFLEYSIEKCKNSSANNFSCASENEIMAILPYISIQISLPKTFFDFKDVKNPRKRTYDYQFFQLDPKLIKSFKEKITPVFLYTDKGIYDENYKLDSIDLLPVELLSDSLQREPNDDKFFVYSLELSFDQEIYYRENDKIQKLMANFGGVINIFLIIGNLFSTSYNYLKLKHKLINSSFQNLDARKKRK